MRVKNISLLGCMFLILTMPACLQQKKNQKAADPDQAAFLPADIETNIDIYVQQRMLPDYELEAHIDDIPFMINSSVQELTSVDGQSRHYLCGMPYSFEEIERFYKAAMEYEGWKEIAHAQGLELLLIFEKPHAICMLSIRGISSRLQRQLPDIRSILHITIATKTHEPYAYST